MPVKEVKARAVKCFLVRISIKKNWTCSNSSHRIIWKNCFFVRISNAFLSGFSMRSKFNHLSLCRLFQWNFHHFSHQNYVSMHLWLFCDVFTTFDCHNDRTEWESFLSKCSTNQKRDFSFESFAVGYFWSHKNWENLEKMSDKKKYKRSPGIPMEIRGKLAQHFQEKGQGSTDHLNSFSKIKKIHFFWINWISEFDQNFLSIG